MSVARAVLMEAGLKSEVQWMDLMDSGRGGLELFRHFAEDLNGQAEVVGSSGTPVQAVGDGVQIGLTVHGKIGALGEVLAQQAVGVLAGAALPGAVRIAEVDVDAALLGQRRVERHRLALVIGEGLAHGGGDAAQLCAEVFHGRGRRRVGHLRQRLQAGLALDQHRNGRAVGRSLDEVAFPVVRHQVVIDPRPAHVDANGIQQMAAPILTARASLPLAAALPQPSDQHPAQFTLGGRIDRRTNGLVREVSVAAIGPHATQCAGDLRRRPPPIQQSGDPAQQQAVWRRLGRRTRRNLTSRRRNLRRLGGIPRTRHTIAAQLAADRAGAAAQPPSGLTHARSFPRVRGQQHSFFRLKLPGTPSFVHASPYEMPGVAVRL